MAGDPFSNYSKLLKDGLSYKKWHSGATLTGKVKQVAVNVMLKTLECNPDMTLSELFMECSDLLGIGEDSLRRIRKDLRSKVKERPVGMYVITSKKYVKTVKL